MNSSENLKKEESKPTGQPLFQVESFNKAVASRDEIISGHETTIGALQQQIGSQQTSISELMKKLKNVEDARIAAESELAQYKNLKKDYSTMGGFKPKTEEELFAEKYQKAKENLRK